ncbi:hypothetical protein QC762_0003510 [Podospora pseudocomata]|uniref:Uncharacterized protein n=1 Tax=Podospora pseudocomata TaxID=2093779 RepID=A0ABR0GT33_9PEZI|nr:hypothetical protein QC762_0003510 [Podospora pseudocomata]
MRFQSSAQAQGKKEGGQNGTVPEGLHRCCNPRGPCGLAAAVEINRSHWLEQSARRGTPAARPDNCVGPDSCVGL